MEKLRIKMKTFFEKIKKHIDSSSKEQLQAEWEELKKYNDVGPLMLDVLNNKTKKQFLGNNYINKVNGNK